MNPREHWNRIYATKGTDVSWFEPRPAVSLELLDAVGLTSDTCFLDVGGGESTLVDALLARGLHCLTVLDVSDQALEHTRARLGAAAASVRWIHADVTGAWTSDPVNIWHDRAVFHFLLSPADRGEYKSHLLATLKHGGAVIIGTFALDGPPVCSGLPVRRYSADSLAEELGEVFRLEEARHHSHVTPWGTSQAFQFARFKRIA